MSESSIVQLRSEFVDGEFDIVHAMSFSALQLLLRIFETSIKSHARVLFSYFETPHLRRPDVQYPVLSNQWAKVRSIDLNKALRALSAVAVPFSFAYEDWLKEQFELREVPIRRCPHILSIERVSMLAKLASTRLPGMPGRYVFVCSRLVERKGIVPFLDVVQKVTERVGCEDFAVVVSSANFSLTQSRAGHESLIQEIDQRDLSKTVHIIRYDLTDDDVFRLYNGAAYVVMPSIYEGYGLVPLEAGLCSKVVVAYNIRGLAETTRHMDNALLVPEFDSMQMTDALAKLWTDGPYCQELGRRARTWVEGYLRDLARRDDYLHLLGELDRMSLSSDQITHSNAE